jgi:polar amino acid transport system substrate-binding protein
MNRRNIIGLISVTAFGLAILPGAAFAQQVLNVGYAPFNSPFTFLPGAAWNNYQTLDPKGTMAQGALVDVINAIAKDAGVQVKFVPVAVWDQAAALASNRIGLTTTEVGTSPDNKLAMVFTRPIYNTSDTLLVKKSDTKQYTTYEDLKGAVIGAQKGTISADALVKSGIFLEVKLYATAPELAQAVHEDDIKAGFYNSVIALTYELQHGMRQDLQIVKSYQPMFVTATVIGARKDDGDMLKKIDTSLAKLKADGTVKAIFTKYGLEGNLVN